MTLIEQKIKKLISGQQHQLATTEQQGQLEPHRFGNTTAKRSMAATVGTPCLGASMVQL